MALSPVKLSGLFSRSPMVRRPKYMEAKVYDSTDMLSSIWRDLTQNEYDVVISGTEYKTDNKIKTSFVNTYKGPLFIGNISKDSSGKEVYRSEYKLDDKGFISESSSTEVMKDTTKTTRYTYKYDSFDEKGNWTQRTRFDDKGKAVKIQKRKITYYKD